MSHLNPLMLSATIKISASPMEQLLKKILCGISQQLMRLRILRRLPMEILALYFKVIFIGLVNLRSHQLTLNLIIGKKALFSDHSNSMMIL